MEPVQNKTDLFARIQMVEANLRGLGVQSIAVFGSFITGKVDFRSDVDVLVEFGEGQKTYDHLYEVHELLEQVLGRPVDVVTVKALSPHLGPHILKQAEYVPFAA